MMSVCFSTGTAISIHAPARGATVADWLTGWMKSNFNPRSREGSDEKGSELVEIPLDISIHAPARGATISSTDRLQKRS